MHNGTVLIAIRPVPTPISKTFFVLLSSIAVSYTHLDVYKRQVPLPSKLRPSLSYAGRWEKVRPRSGTPVESGHSREITDWGRDGDKRQGLWRPVLSEA